jgi:BirA family transcriptional regulator, biotin operon repressor / biotin---[acetyl-CoA-carboxylase] ligase
VRSPVDDGPLLIFESVDSTQDVAAALLREGSPVGAVLAYEQTAGRGRFGRVWHSPPRECLAVSLVFSAYAGHPRPYLIGMSIAVAAARAFGCELQWPNDLVIEGRKLGGILTELLPTTEGESVPVVGMGLNLGQHSFPPDIADVATSLSREGLPAPAPEEALKTVLDVLPRLPEPSSWQDLAPHWMSFDRTPGKRYRLHDGREATARSIGPDGQLICSTDGQEMFVLAAEAVLNEG